MDRPIRVLVGKPGMDAHDRGAKVIARALRDGGMEVIYTGIRQSPQEIVDAAVDEDVDVIGLSILSGAHNTLLPKIIDLLRQAGRDDVILIVGGIVPAEDVPRLKELGVAEIFGPGSDVEEIVRYVRHAVSERRGVSS